jgi:wyosine [tRNA(Phe)-imidazoG37] synthetase (radical SAM superfamily)
LKIPRSVIETYVKTSYRVVGNHKHSSIKPCYWLEQKLLTGRKNRNCYKGYWGVNSEQCIQNTPSFPFCTHNCVFCWRDTSCSLGSEFTVTPDDPEYLVEELIRHQKNLIQHQYPLKKILQNFEVCYEILEYFKKQDKMDLISSTRINKNISTPSKGVVNKAILLLRNCEVLKTDDLMTYSLSDLATSILENTQSVRQVMDQMVSNETDIKNSFNRALHPNHAAISLDGEPTLYPYIGEFVGIFRKKKFTTFIVTNGTTPETLLHLHETNCLPSILYVTIPPPNIRDYTQIHRPKVKGAWDKIHQTLDLLKDLKTRTVLRITAVNHLNIRDDLIDGYVETIDRAQPNFVDIKGFTLEGASMSISNRLETDQPGNYYFPDYLELDAFAQKITEKSGFRIIETHEKSRDILLSVNWNRNAPLALQEYEK